MLAEIVDDAQAVSIGCWRARLGALKLLAEIVDDAQAVRIGESRVFDGSQFSPSPKGGSEKGNPTNKSLKSKFEVT